MLPADKSEISCSAERPPNSSTTRVFDFASASLMSSYRKAARAASRLRAAAAVVVGAGEAELAEEEAPLVDQLGDDLAERLAGAVAGLRLEAQEHRVTRARGRLQARRHLARVQR